MLAAAECVGCGAPAKAPAGPATTPEALGMPATNATGPSTPALSASSPAEAAPSATTPGEASRTAAPAGAPGRDSKPAEQSRDAAPADSRHASEFPPKALTPPSARSAEANDGVWTPFGSARTSSGRAPLYSTKLHPHPTSRFVTLTLVAIDLSATRLGFMPGVLDVGTQKVPFEPGVVPAAERERTIAAFNGGFMPRHGRWGMVRGETTIVPPRDPGCTIGLHGSGVRIRSWSVIAPEAPRYLSLRQTPPCLVEQGALHPLLLKGQDKAWAGHTPGVVTRRRSAIGINREGTVLYYGVGVETPARLLAEGMLAAGAHDAAELDINWNWTRFLTFAKNAEGELRVDASLVDVEHSNRAYVERASERDFFYVVQR